LRRDRELRPISLRLRMRCRARHRAKCDRSVSLSSLAYHSQINRSTIKKMPELSDVVTVRKLPDGGAQPARIGKPDIDHLTVFQLGIEEGDLNAGILPIGTLVEISGAEAIYFGKVVASDSGPSGTADAGRFTVSVEHVVDRAALAEIDTAWKATGA
jgi:hypothetical protein